MLTRYLTPSQLEHLASFAASRSSDGQLEHLCDLALEGDDEVNGWLVRIVSEDPDLVEWMERI